MKSKEKTQFLVTAKRDGKVIETLRLTAPSTEMAIKRACVLRPIKECAIEAKKVPWKLIVGRTAVVRKG